MSRRARTNTNTVSPDPIFNNKMLTKLINRSMKDGKKSVAARQVYKALDIIKEKTGDDPLKTFSKALENVRPEMEVRARRIGGAAYQVPTSVRPVRKDSLAIRWIVNAANARSGETRTYSAKLAAELIAAANMDGAAVKKRMDMDRISEANRAFAHFKW